MRPNTCLLALLTTFLLVTGCGDDKKNTPDDTSDTPGDTDSDSDAPDAPDTDMTMVDMGPDVMDAEFGLDDRPANPNCVAWPRPPVAADIELEQVFGDISLSLPVYMVQAPGDDTRWYVVEKPGTIAVFDNEDAVSMRADFLDITGRVDSGPNEAGLLGMAFHPDWANNRTVYALACGEDVCAAVVPEPDHVDIGRFI